MDDINAAVCEMPKPLQAGSLGRRNIYNALGDSTNTSNSTSTSSGSKPITRSPSRPLSGATTATDTTVKAKAKANQSLRPPTPIDHRVHVQTEVLGATGKQKKANVFSVSIQGPRKLSSRESSVAAVRQNGASSPIPADQPSRSLWSGRFRSGSGSSAGAHSSKSTVGEPSTFRETPPPPVPPKASTSAKVSRPVLVTSASRPPARQDTVNTLNSPPPPYEHSEYHQYSESEDLAGRCSPLCGLPSPRLTPVSEKGKEKERDRDRDKDRVRNVERSRGVERAKEAERDRLREAEKQRVWAEQEKEKERERVRQQEKEILQRDKERARGSRDRQPDVARERDRRKGKEKEVEITQPRRVGSPGVKERERESRPAAATTTTTTITPAVAAAAAAAAQVAAAPIEKVASGSGSGNSKKSKESITATKVKRTKHGSFDFERPVSGAMNMRTALRGLGVGFYGHAPQPLDKSLSKESGVRPQDLSQHRQEPSAQSHWTGRSGKRPTVDVTAATLARSPTENSQSPNPNSATRSHFHYSDFDPVSPHSSQSAHSSSLGRSAGNRALRGAHGAFKFEPAVPPIPGSPAGDERGAHAIRGLNPQPERAKLARAASVTKGRSLDLGLSLSWAPQRVREEAILSYTQPGIRQAATTSRVRSRWRTAVADEHGRLDSSTTGSASSVAAAFKEALGDAAYGTFKNCEFFSAVLTVVYAVFFIDTLLCRRSSLRCKRHTSRRAVRAHFCRFQTP